MSTFLQFALLGLGAGGAYAIAGVGLVQVYRGSGVLNLSHGAIALVAAVFYLTGRTRWDWGFVPSVVVALLAAMALGAIIEGLAMRPLRRAAPLVKITATLGIFAVVEAGVPLVFGSNYNQTSVQSFYPEGHVTLAHGVTLPYDRLIVLGITIVIAVVLREVSARTRFGLATTASAENAVVSASMGVNPNVVGLVNWILGAGLAGIAGILLLPIIGVADATTFLLLVVPALAAGMIGRFRSFARTVAAGLGIGIGQSLLTRYDASIFPTNLASGWPDALPFLVIVGVLATGGTPFPTRIDIAARLPKLGRTVANPLTVLSLCVLAIIVTPALSSQWASAVSASASLGIVGLSLVVITGLAGQASLGQMAIAGSAALIATRVSSSLGWPFPVAAALGIVGGALVGLLFAAPALRTRGPTLAVATLGIGLVVEEVVLNNQWFTGGGFSGTTIRSPTLGPLSIDGVTHAPRYAAVAVVAVLVAAWAVANFRGGPVGRRLVAIRNSERAAAACGISLARTKMAAFVLSAAIASLGGVLMAFQTDSITFTQFNLVSMFNLFVFTLIGGIGYVLGPIIGSLGSPNGLMSLFNQHSTVQEVLVLASGFGLILTLVFNPHGVVAGWPARPKLPGRRTKGEGAPEPANASAGSLQSYEAVRRTLAVAHLTVSYGNVTAVDDVSLTVAPGEIVGLIGPNGAGKSTFIDAVTGFVRARRGSVLLDDLDLTGGSVDRRVRAGIGRSFQTVEPFDDLTVAENIAVGSDRIRWYEWFSSLVKPGKAVLHPSFRVEAESMGLDLDLFPDALSQGKRRAMGVLRGLARGPSVLLLDEPAAGLDRDETARLGVMLRLVAKERKVGLLLVEHDMSLVSAVCDRIVMLDFGQMIFSGTVHEAFQSPVVRAAYLGEDFVVPDPRRGVAAQGSVQP